MRALTRLENKQNYGAICTTYFYLPPKPAPDLIRGTEIGYKAQSPGKLLAQHNKAQGSGDRVNVLIRGGLSLMWGVSLFGEMFGWG